MERLTSSPLSHSLRGGGHGSKQEVLEGYLVSVQETPEPWGLM